MLSKSNRLTSQEIDRVMETGKRIDFTFFWAKKIPAHTFKLALMVPRKVLNKAHDRNNAKRKLSALFEEFKGHFPAVFLTVTLSKNFTDADKEEIKNNIASLL